MEQLAAADEKIQVPGVGEKPPKSLSRQTLAKVVESRYSELFGLIQAELRRSGFEDLMAAGIVLTGGSSKMEGVVELAEEVFHMPVSLGMPRSIVGHDDIVRNPIYATCVGLLMYGKEREEAEVTKLANRSGRFARFKKWLSDNI